MKLTQLFAAAALSSCCAVAAAGPLTGQTLGATGGGSFPPAPLTAVVGPGIEFTRNILDVSFSIDFDETGLVVVTWNGPGGLGNSSLDTETYSDVNGTIADIIGFTLLSTSGVTGIDQSDLSFTANAITMRTGDSTVWSEGDSFRAQLEFAVPEPGTLALLGFGLASLAALRRRR